jgi:cobalt-zinc-cadmium efflux system protein
MSHTHHSHDHGHTIDREKWTAFALGVGLNLAFAIAEATFGFFSNSMALISDAVHNFSDVGGLVLAWWASSLAKREPTWKHTYGLRKSTILAALVNSIFLLIAVGAIGWEAVGRVINPPKVTGGTLIAVALLGVVINTMSAMMFMKERKSDLNVRAAFMHLAADAAVSFGVVLAGIIIILTGWTIIDPVVSLLVSLAVVSGTWSILRQSLNLALDAVPEHVDLESVRSYLERLDGVTEVHDLHVWALSTTETALTVHLRTDGRIFDPRFINDVSWELKEHHGIQHATMQFEPPGCDGQCIHIQGGTCEPCD